MLSATSAFVVGSAISKSQLLSSIAKVSLLLPKLVLASFERPTFPSPSASPSTSSTVQARLHKLNLPFKLSLIESLVEQLEETETKHKSLHIMLSHLHHVIEHIHQWLGEIDTRVTEHEAKWFPAWRALDCEQPLSQLQDLKEQLEEGFNLLVGIWTPLNLGRQPEHNPIAPIALAQTKSAPDSNSNQNSMDLNSTTPIDTNESYPDDFDQPTSSSMLDI